MSGLSRAVAKAELVCTERADCGCPEEHYLFNGVDLWVHYDADGEADAFMDAGDWEADYSVRSMASRHAARLAVFAWADRQTEGPAL